MTDAVKLYSTRDAGKKWAARDLPSCIDLKRSAGTVEFVDERQGVYVQGECITKTSDGGETWGPLGLQPKRGSLVYAADFDTSLQKGFVAGCICVPQLATEGVPNFALAISRARREALRQFSLPRMEEEVGRIRCCHLRRQDRVSRSECEDRRDIRSCFSPEWHFRSPDMGQTWVAVRFDPKCNRPTFPEEFENRPVTMASPAETTVGCRTAMVIYFEHWTEEEPGARSNRPTPVATYSGK